MPWERVCFSAFEVIPFLVVFWRTLAGRELAPRCFEGRAVAAGTPRQGRAGGAGRSLAGPRGVRRWQESHWKAIKGVTLLICFLFIKKKKKKEKATNKAVSQDPSCN